MADDSNIKFLAERYEACNGMEYFLSYEDVEADILIALLRLRFPYQPHRSELKHAALVRDLHVYGELAGLGERKINSWQHRGYGARLLNNAEAIARDNGYREIAVMNNANNVHSYESTNLWRSDEKIAYTYNETRYTNYLGNYWDDYTGTDADGDGLGDTPYPINSDKDNYPLMEKFEHYIQPDIT
ncbi:MAG TPA: hypothetical protein C5S37_02925 [Methanophagales archaeon]|nr:hypothetical protein [Methanophagales archaeon]